ncbi:MAG TPA: ATP-dependent zinc protease [Cellvibrionaceae bacterium]|nr:ATP-dependent zinc protease [Cellvibrionaceae bacterium]
MTERVIATLLSLLLLSISGCAANDIKMNALSEGQQRQAEQLSNQERALKAQSDQLAGLSQQQAEVTHALADMAAQLRMTNMQLSTLSFNSPPLAPNVASLPSAPEAPAKKARKETKPEVDTSKDSAKLVIGRVEWVWIDALNKKLKARVDTGATLSSIHATKIERFERDGKNWVRFTMQVNTEGEQGTNVKEQEFEAPLARNAKIRLASAEEIDARPVVRLRMRLGHLEEDVDFTLTNRSEMNYPILLGRRFLQDIAVVDVSLKFTQSLEAKAKP